jgi:peptidoglycan/xylan/chitin deacetylase (PgdA/CDA1 family)
MGRHWNWDFEDQRKAAQVDEPSPAVVPTAQPPEPEAHPRALFRRRRMVASIVLVVAIATAVAVSLASSNPRGAPSKSARALLPRRARSHASDQPSDPQQRGEAAVRSVLAYTPFVKEGTQHARDVALTFDDGPGPYTPELLSVLERFHVHATFFVIGEMLRYFSASAVRELKDGDVIGDHTETHPEMATLSAHDQYEELFEQIARIELLGGPRPELFRPPYGSFDATTMHELRRLHLLMVLWSVDTDDYLQPGVAAIEHSALTGAHPGAIILMHDAGGDRSQTIAALPTIIRGLRARGFRLVTVPQLLVQDPPPAGLPLPPNLSGD